MDEPNQLEPQDNITAKHDDKTVEIEIKDGDKVPIKDVVKCEDILLKNQPNSSSEIHQSNNSGVCTTEAQYMDEANLHYENSICIYTEPESKSQFVWNEEKHEWVPRSSPLSSDKDYEYDGQTYTYTDKETRVKYLWDVDKNEWKVDEKNVSKAEVNDKKAGENEADDMEKPKEALKQDMSKGQYSWENGTHIYTDPSDASKYFWDNEKNAWIPKVDDDFLAQYQMNYGFVDPQNDEEKKEEPPAAPPVDSVKRKAPQEPAWFDVGEESTKVYVSGLPLDITETEFVDVMQKCGLVMRDIDTGNMKVKIYLDPKTSLPKGDALCTYIKKESVKLALDLIDGSEIRGNKLSVERAKFTMKGKAYDPALKPKKKRKKDKEKIKKIQEKLLDWRPDKLRGERSKHEKTVIVKNLFDPAIFGKDVKLILEYQQDLRDECLKCGSVKKVIIYDRQPEGVAQINFKEFEAADACVQLLNGRWFGQRKITAEPWDGKTKYKINETDEQIKSRLQKWEKFLETGEAVDDPNKDATEGKKSAEENMAAEKTKSEGATVAEEKTKSEGATVAEEKTKREAATVAEEKIKSECATVAEEKCHKSPERKDKIESGDVEGDSDGNTRSSVGSEYDTDEEVSKNE